MITLYEQLSFSYNWNNKLACTSFTTFRLHNPRKYAVGRKLSIMLQGKNLKDVEIMAVKTMKLNQVNEFIARIDTGYGVTKFQEIVQTMYKNKGIDFETANWDLVLCNEIKLSKAEKIKVQKVQLPLEIV